MGGAVMESIARAGRMTVFSQRLAGHLMTLGFVLLGIDKNRSDPNKNVFYFRDSEKIRTIIQNYSANTPNTKER